MIKQNSTCSTLESSGFSTPPPPHSSHFGGSWERMIGVVRRILDGVMLDPNNHNITHEVLCTLLAEVTAIVNSRPLTPVSTDPDSPFVLTPNTLLTQKFVSIDKCEFMCNEFNRKDMIKSAWKRVQGLANQFWKRWQSEYLHLLQVHRKWEETTPNVKEGDVVLVKSDKPRCQWPLATIQEVYESQDSLVRKVKVKMFKNNQSVTFVRPISKIIPLLAV